MTNKAILNEEQSKLVAQKLAPLNFRKELYQREYLTFSANKETKLRVFLYSAAICHQTHTLINRKRNLVGWNYLEYAFTKLGKENSTLLDPTYLSNTSVNELADKLKPLFSEDDNPANCTLDRLEERAQFLIDIAKILNQKYNGKVENILEISNGYLLNNGRGFYDLLAEFPAFSDPLRKKITVVIKCIIEADLWNFKDLENIMPIMDYHMQRVLLRTGCVEVLDEELKKSLLERKPLLSDEDIRSVAILAVKKIAELAKKNILDMNDFFWSIGRSCCKDKTLCTEGVCDKKPCTFFFFADLPSHEHCIFEEVCKGKKDPEYRSFWQPIVDTNYY